MLLCASHQLARSHGRAGQRAGAAVDGHGGGRAALQQEPRALHIPALRATRLGVVGVMIPLLAGSEAARGIMPFCRSKAAVSIAASAVHQLRVLEGSAQRGA